MSAAPPNAPRRRLLAGGLALLARTATGAGGAPARSAPPENPDVEYGRRSLPAGIRSRRVAGLHLLEAGHETPGRPCIVLLHGFPELAYTWRQQLLPLARAGYHVLAPDARGYGLSAVAPVAWTDSLVPYSMLSRVSDVLTVVRGCGHAQAALVVGHDWGGPTAQWCARLRPDVFQAVVSISTPFFAAPALPLTAAAATESTDAMDRALAALPRPRKRYFGYYASRGANQDFWHAPQGVPALLRALYYFKSADWPGNQPFRLAGWTATELAKMPTYYIMDLEQGVAQTVRAVAPSPAYAAACRWLTETDLQVYASQFERTGFQGGLNYYRVDGDADLARELDSGAGRLIEVPACYLGGAQEWAVYQSPGAFEAMHTACTRLSVPPLVPAAGHSLVEEQPDAVNRRLLEFLAQVHAT